MTIQTSAIIRIKLHNNNLQSFELILIKFSFKQNKKAINTLEAHRIEMHEFGIVIVQKLHYTNTTRSIYKIQVTTSVDVLRSQQSECQRCLPLRMRSI